MYIEENKALIKRMLGDFSSLHSNKDDAKSKSITFNGSLISQDSKSRKSRSIYANNEVEEKVDICLSTVEIVTPYWASNSGGKIRAIVNTQHLQQAIQQEVCQ
jgi:hypothetical protein